MKVRKIHRFNLRGRWPDEDEIRSANATFKANSMLLDVARPVREILSNVQVLARRLASGSKAKILLVRYRGQLSCLKLFHRLHFMSPMLREALLLQRLNGAGGSPTVLAVASDVPVMVMSLCHGHSLSLLMKHPWKWTMVQWLKMFKGVAERLQEIHQQNIIHNDIKADTILIETAREQLGVSILDFSNSLMRGQKCFYKSTQYWIAPEVAPESPMEPPSDVYSLGVLLKEFVMSTRGVFFTPRIMWPPEFLDLVSGMISYCPKNRPTLDEAISILDNLINPILTLTITPTNNPTTLTDNDNDEDTNAINNPGYTIHLGRVIGTVLSRVSVQIHSGLFVYSRQKSAAYKQNLKIPPLCSPSPRPHDPLSEALNTL